MKLVRLLLSVSLASLSVAGCAAPPPPAPAAASEDQMLGHALTLVETIVRAAAKSDDPQSSLKAVDDVLAGRDPQANQALQGLLQEATADLSPANRDRVAAIGRDMTALARRQAAAAPLAESPAADRALQARKDLTAMGLRYYDEDQFRAAVKRGDKLAVDLFIAGKGIDPAVVSRTLPAGR